MSKPKSYKLGEVAISFERSIATVVADLQALGFSVENKPNARISEEAYAALGQKYGRLVKSKDVPAPPPPTPPQPEEPSLPAEESSLPVVGKVELPSPRRRLPPPPQKPRPLITSPIGSSTPSTALPSDSPAPPPQEASLTPFQAEVPSPSEVSTSTSPLS
jgi:translation initiation factor IF-2